MQKKHKFTDEEDLLLIALVRKYGEQDWATISSNLKNRNPRQCRERWKYYLSADMKPVLWTPMDDKLLIEKVGVFGKKWSVIIKFFDGKNEISLKNRYRKLLKEKKCINSSNGDIKSMDKKQFIRVFIDLPGPLSSILGIV